VIAPLWIDAADKNKMDVNNYTSKFFDKIFEDFVERFGLKTRKYILYGFSGGGGYVQRNAQFSDSKYIDYAIVHSPGGECAYVDENLPCSKGGNAYRSAISYNFENRKMYILAGSKEQGSLVNAINLFETGKAYSEANRLSFSWGLFVMEGIAHACNNATLPYILDIMNGFAPLFDAGDFYPDTTKPTPASVTNSQGKVIVGPLLKTHWTQGDPYNSMLPMVDGGKRHASAGCMPVAMAQIMRYHKHPKRGNGQSKPYTTKILGIEIPSVNFEIDYDWDNMLDKYTSNATERQRNAVATLMYHVGVSMNTEYKDNASSGKGTGVGELATFFGYDKGTLYLLRKYYDDAAWEAIIKEQLDLGLPIWADVGGEKGGAHSIVIDGYDNKGKFHINWGWGGNRDGYYSIAKLALETETKDFCKEIRINIMPDKGGVARYAMALDTFTVAKTAVTQNEPFTVAAKINKQSVSPFDGQMGAALADSKGNIAAVVGFANFWSKSINCFVPDSVKAGQYSLRIVTRPTGGEWSVVTLYNRTNGITNAINITVSEERGAKGGGYGLALRAISSDKATVSINEQFTVTSLLRNLGADFSGGGQTGVALVDNNGNIVSVIGSRNEQEIGGGIRTAPLNCKVPDTVPAGQYNLRTLAKAKGKDVWRIVTWTVDGNVTTAIPIEVR